MGEACSTHARNICACRFLVEKREEKRPFGRHKRRWKENIKWIFMEYVGVEWIDLA
jgi:hypothetical protein